MSDDYSAECERKSACCIEVNRYAGERPGTGQVGQTRQSGVVSTNLPNPRESQQATFKGRELLRRANSR